MVETLLYIFLLIFAHIKTLKQTMRKLMLLISLFTVIGTGCKEISIKHQVDKMMSSTVKVPEDITVLFNGKTQAIDSMLPHGKNLYIFIDSTECSACRITKLDLYDNIFALAKNTDAFNVIVLFSPLKKEQRSAIKHILSLNMDVPIFFDSNHSFRKDNAFIPDDQKFHVFLTDKYGKIILVGDPSASQKMMNLFSKTLQLSI